MAQIRLAGLFYLIASALFQSESALPATSADELQRRADFLPHIGENETCTISLGTRGTVPLQSHIFGGALWFGAGPVYFALAWKSSSDDGATFPLEPVPQDRNARRAKTPWVSSPSYSGPILIRGRALTASGMAILFSATGSDPSNQLRFMAPNSPAPGLWSFWPSSMWVPGPGCYGVQIDTLSGTDIVVFEAT